MCFIPSPGYFPNPGIEPRSPALRQILYHPSHQGSLAHSLQTPMERKRICVLACVTAKKVAHTFERSLLTCSGAITLESLIACSLGFCFWTVLAWYSQQQDPNSMACCSYLIIHPGWVTYVKKVLSSPGNMSLVWLSVSLGMVQNQRSDTLPGRKGCLGSWPNRVVSSPHFLQD